MSFRLSFINDFKQLYANEIKDISEDKALDSIILVLVVLELKKVHHIKVF